MIPPDMQPPPKEPEYHHELYKDEELMPDKGGVSTVPNITKYIPLEHTPVCDGSFVAKIFFNGLHTQTFHIAPAPMGYSFEVPHFISCWPECFDAQLNPTTGELACLWKTPPGPHKILATYEVIYDCDPKTFRDLHFWH